MTASASSVAYDALNLGRQNERDIAAHEDICAIRYQNINDTLAELKGWVKWAGGAGFTLIIGLLAFLAAAQFNNNDVARRDQQVKIDELQRQLSERR